MARAGKSAKSVKKVNKSRVALWAALAVILVWFGVSSFTGQIFGQLSTVQENDAAAFLPASAESTKVNEIEVKFSDGNDSLPALVLFSGDGLAAALPEIQKFVADAGTLEVPESGGRVVNDFLIDGAQLVPFPSEDGQAVLLNVPLSSDALIDPLEGNEQALVVIVETLREAAKEVPGIEAYVTGPGGILADLFGVFGEIDTTLLVVTLSVVAIILAFVYRSPTLWLIPLFSALIALTTAGAIVYYLAKADIVTLNGQSQGILFVLVIGAATDYALLMISRYREELHHYPDPWSAMKAAWRGVVEPILASGSTASLGLLVLLASELNSNRSTGPVAAVGIASAMLVMLTLLPALLLVPSASLPLLAGVVVLAVGFGITRLTDLELSAVLPFAGLAALVVFVAVVLGGLMRLMKKPPQWARWVRVPAARWVFWPKVPDFDDVDPKLMGIWASVARAVGTRPRWAWVISTLVLVGAGAFAFQLNNDGIDQTEALISRPDSVIGQEELAKHFPAGSGSPTIIIAPEAKQAEVAAAALEIEGVEAIEPRRVGPVIPGQPEPPIRVEDGLVLLEATTAGAADSVETRAAIPQLRDAVRSVSPQALVGGFTAVGYDTQQASTRDRNLIIPVVLLVILLILILLLRSIVAPLLLLGTVVLSFLATLGVSYLVFNYLFAEWFNAPGFLKADASFPLFAFVFLVALGIDYNIFLMTRVREETKKLGTRPGILKGLTVTGGVITSAGIVLAATFAVLGVLPLVFLAQIGFAVSFGVLLDTFLVRSILVPALSYDIGQKIWWPSKLAFVKQPKVKPAPYEPAKAVTAKR